MNKQFQRITRRCNTLGNLLWLPSEHLMRRRSSKDLYCHAEIRSRLEHIRPHPVTSFSQRTSLSEATWFSRCHWPCPHLAHPSGISGEPETLLHSCEDRNSLCSCLKEVFQKKKPQWTFSNRYLQILEVARSGSGSQGWCRGHSAQKPRAAVQWRSPEWSTEAACEQ